MRSYSSETYSIIAIIVATIVGLTIADIAGGWGFPRLLSWVLALSAAIVIGWITGRLQRRFNRKQDGR
jgi:hypothetical protein